jgi:hypothetical protein
VLNEFWSMQETAKANNRNHREKVSRVSNASPFHIGANSIDKSHAGPSSNGRMSLPAVGGMKRNTAVPPSGSQYPRNQPGLPEPHQLDVARSRRALQNAGDRPETRSYQHDLFRQHHAQGEASTSKDVIDVHDDDNDSGEDVSQFVPGTTRRWPPGFPNASAAVLDVPHRSTSRSLSPQKTAVGDRATRIARSFKVIPVTKENVHTMSSEYQPDLADSRQSGDPINLVDDEDEPRVLSKPAVKLQNKQRGRPSTLTNEDPPGRSASPPPPRKNGAFGAHGPPAEPGSVIGRARSGATGSTSPRKIAQPPTRTSHRVGGGKGKQKAQDIVEVMDTGSEEEERVEAKDDEEAEESIENADGPFRDDLKGDGIEFTGSRIMPSRGRRQSGEIKRTKRGSSADEWAINVNNEVKISPSVRDFKKNSIARSGPGMKLLQNALHQSVGHIPSLSTMLIASQTAKSNAQDRKVNKSTLTSSKVKGSDQRMAQVESAWLNELLLRLDIASVSFERSALVLVGTSEPRAPICRIDLTKVNAVHVSNGTSMHHRLRTDVHARYPRTKNNPVSWWTSQDCGRQTWESL